MTRAVVGWTRKKNRVARRCILSSELGVGLGRVFGRREIGVLALKDDGEGRFDSDVAGGACETRGQSAEVDDAVEGWGSGRLGEKQRTRTKGEEREEESVWRRDFAREPEARGRNHMLARVGTCPP
ncbi:uncharacterized protein A4U43_C07F24130 [Asparagus officinalis]|uniref:Uncharacterized protein n=1 Tax=Asparagus officinalis TaxID=4686 RepID=A0A5P1EJQ5_ASPOF|nr:uncharacterized protein A4U43_C07F24130 [Asparagus officinalis]